MNTHIIAVNANGLFCLFVLQTAGWTAVLFALEFANSIWINNGGSSKASDSTEPTHL